MVIWANSLLELELAKRDEWYTEPKKKTTMNASPFSVRQSTEQVEEGVELAPKLYEHGPIHVVTTDFISGNVLINAEALPKTIKLSEAVHRSHSRKCLWHKGATSDLLQRLREIGTDDDQDCIWLHLDVQGGASCHVRYRSCFYRAIPIGKRTGRLATGIRGNAEGTWPPRWSTSM